MTVLIGLRNVTARSETLSRGWGWWFEHLKRPGWKESWRQRQRFKAEGTDEQDIYLLKPRESFLMSTDLFLSEGCFVEHSSDDLAEELLAQLLPHQLHQGVNLFVFQPDHLFLVVICNKFCQPWFVGVKLILYCLFLSQILAALNLLLQPGDVCN